MSASVAADTARLVETARDPAVPLREQQRAFTRLVEQSQHHVFGLALTLLGDADDAGDAVQEAYATAWLRLRQLRDPAAFPAWLRTIVATRCARQRRRRARRAEAAELPQSADADSHRVDYQALIASAVAALPKGERHVTVLFYFLGYSQADIARLLRLKPGTVAKRLHSARLRIRRRLPPSVRSEFVRVAPSRTFAEKVHLGIYDEYVGEYRFARRPELVVSIVREGDSLVSVARGQRHVLASLGDASFVTRHYDGEGRFGRNRQGEVTHFVYYEFGERLGIAWRMDVASSTASPATL
ncbi:MAG TPA: sigma-70 family RNA polymerase sigma factor [Longimicrobiaceae bacterium]|nr:sigma-70 family RNA polymerase sigma factor [Longimicrobiaceae bacterium]